jgi:uncharacterized protein
VISVSLVPIPLRISALTLEQKSLLEYPVERLADIISDVGFHCTGCAKCCTRIFNGHVFLLDRDVAAVRRNDPDAIEPAPDPEFCDQNGTFYVSGYALRAKDDKMGSCWFLENGRCRIYDDRFFICRIYPYMLHREPDDSGTVDWRQISGIELHGEYNREIAEDEAFAAARETKEYENAFLAQEIAFLEYIQDFFSRNKLRHVQKVYDDRTRAFSRGFPIRVMVFYDGGFEEHTVQKG